MGDEIIHDISAQLDLCVKHYHNLSVPKDNERFDANYYDIVVSDLQHIRDLAEQDNSGIEIACEEIVKVNKSLHNKKASDEYGLCAEPLKLISSYYICHVFVKLFNKIWKARYFPKHLNQSVLTSVPKKGKDETHLDNHRGISITPVIGKVFESILTSRHNHIQNEIQDDLQFGFTKNRSPSMASLLLNEAFVEAKETKTGIAVVTLDVQKAFDTVFWASNLRKIFLHGLDIETWSLIDSLYDDVCTKDKGKVERNDE